MNERAERTLVAWCPDWPVVAAGAALDQPAIVVHANRVVACSPAARAEGVVEGLRRREAQGRCPQAELLAHDPARGARVFEPAVAALDVLCPRVEITRPGSCALRRPAAPPATTVATTPSPNGWERCSVAALQGTAPGARRDRRRDASPPPWRPGGPVPTRRWSSLLGASAAFLAPWPVTTLVEAAVAEVAGLPEDRTTEIVDVLGRLGLRTLGALADVPAGDVLARFGTEGAMLRRLARGLDARPLAARQPAPELAVTIELDPPAERVDTAAFVAKGLADELHERLRPAGPGLPPGWPRRPRPSTARRWPGRGATRGRSAPAAWPSGSAGSSTGGCELGTRPAHRPASPCCASVPDRGGGRPRPPARVLGRRDAADERAARALARVRAARARGGPGARAAGRAGPGRAARVVPPWRRGPERRAARPQARAGHRSLAGAAARSRARGRPPRPAPGRGGRRRRRLGRGERPGRAHVAARDRWLAGGGTQRVVGVGWSVAVRRAVVGPGRPPPPGPRPGRHRRRHRPPGHPRRRPLVLEATYD